MTGPAPKDAPPVRDLTPVPLPDWWSPLAERAAAADGDFWRRHAPRTPGGRRAAVLILLGTGADPGGSGPDVLICQRAANMNNHAGQPAFPGGGAEPGDAGMVATALREANEEVGLSADTVVPVTTLPELWLGVSNFRVTPVLAWWREPHDVYPAQVEEVESVARVPVAELVDPANRLRVRHPSGYVGPAFEARGMVVWGFTAGILSAVLDLAGWSRPWTGDRVRTVV